MTVAVEWSPVDFGVMFYLSDCLFLLWHWETVTSKGIIYFKGTTNRNKRNLQQCIYTQSGDHLPSRTKRQAYILVVSTRSASVNTQSFAVLFMSMQTQQLCLDFTIDSLNKDHCVKRIVNIIHIRTGFFKYLLSTYWFNCCNSTDKCWRVAVVTLFFCCVVMDAAISKMC